MTGVELARGLPLTLVKGPKPDPKPGNRTTMNRSNDTSDFRSSGSTSSGQAGPGHDFFGRVCGGRQGIDRWVERTRLYLKSRTADHWLMFIAGLLLGALLA